MCGRYSLTTPVEAMAGLFEFSERPNLAPRYNIAPTQGVPVVLRNESGTRSLTMMRWGLVPSWAKNIGTAPLINARAETVADKPSFKTAFRRRRCLVPADGYYEWQTTAPGKQPYRIVMRNGGIFAFAGIWERWRSRDGSEVLSCAFVTLEPNAMLAAIHDRMPAILPRENHAAWLDPETSVDRLKDLLKPYPQELMRAYPVAKRVGQVANDDPEIIREIAPESKPALAPKTRKTKPPTPQGSLF